MINLVEKNKEYILDVVAQGYEGEGIAKIDNTFPVFVEGALVGEKVKVKIVKSKKSFAYGKLIEIVEESKERYIRSVVVVSYNIVHIKNN